MSTTFRPYLPDQSLLLPPDVREWLQSKATWRTTSAIWWTAWT